MPKFTNQDNATFVLHPAGDYPFRVVAMESSGIQTGTGRTAGSPFWELKFTVEGKGGYVFKRLIDHESCQWVIDTFLKSTGAAPPPGTAFEFDANIAHDSGCLWIDPVGLRGHFHLAIEDYTTSKGEKRQRNAIASFLTDKPKLPRHVEPKSEPEPAAAPADEEPLF